MTKPNLIIRMKRVDAHAQETDYFRERLHVLVTPFNKSVKPRQRFPLPDDAIVFIAYDDSQTDSQGNPQGIASAVITRRPPGEEQSKGLPKDIVYGELKRMVVLPEYHGSGVAAKLLNAAEEAGKHEFGLEYIVIEALHTLKPAIKFYEKHGYKKRAVYGVYHAEDSQCFEKRV